MTSNGDFVFQNKEVNENHTTLQNEIFTFLVFYYYITIVKRDMCHIH